MTFKSGVKDRKSDRWRAKVVSGDCDEVICAGWGEPGGERRVNRMRLTEWRRELIPRVRWCIGYLKEQLVVFNEEDRPTDGRARVTADEELGLHVDWTEKRWCR